MSRIVKTRGGCGRQPWRRPRRPARDGLFAPAELLTMANSRPLNPPSVPTREIQHKAEGETHRRREVSRSGLQIAGHVENKATCSGTVRGGWGQAGCRTGQLHPPQEEDKDEFDVAVCENGGGLVEEVMILENYEEACVVGEGCENDGMHGGWSFYDVRKAEGACRVLGRDGSIQIDNECGQERVSIAICNRTTDGVAAEPEKLRSA